MGFGCHDDFITGNYVVCRGFGLVRWDQRIGYIGDV